MNKIFSFVLLVCLICGLSFSATNTRMSFINGVSKRTIPWAMGTSVTINVDGTSDCTVTISYTTGYGSLQQIAMLKNTGVAITTVNAITGGEIGDIIIFETCRASEDVVFGDVTGLNLGDNRTLSDPADKLILWKRNATNWDELGYYNNN